MRFHVHAQSCAFLHTMGDWSKIPVPFNYFKDTRENLMRYRGRDNSVRTNENGDDDDDDERR